MPQDQPSGLGIDRTALIAALQAQNAVTPAGVVQTGDETILIRVSGTFQSEQDLLAVNFVANGETIRLGDIALVTRGPADPAQPMFRVKGRDAIGLAIAMRKGGDGFPERFHKIVDRVLDGHGLVDDALPSPA
jgi:multidrug efflux pump